MKKLLPALLLAAGALLPVSALHAADPAPAAAETPPQKLPGLPWHMVNIWWRATPVEDFSSFSIDVDISHDFPSDKYNLYISPLCGGINGNNYYGGIQTNVNGWNAMAPDDHKRLHGGHGFIFSRWSDTPTLSLADVRATPGGYVEAAGYEGHFVSGRRPYAWKAGKYTYSLRKLDTQVVDGKPFTWVGGFVHEHATGRDIFVSALRFAGDTLKHNGLNAAFLEFYATSELHTPPDIASLPPLVVKFSNLRFNGEPADLQRVNTRFIRKDEKRKDGLHAPISPNLVHVTGLDDGREVVCSLVNKPFADDEEKDRDLWKKPAAK